ncbi:sodium/hydrogen exchanger family protein [Schizothecium vesticola]|uniref:Sodium/hydrogen exchanger family protein n=1 Tax=Schizothecium vesticola TaxID=314040 RepID=A0AA40F472_9PEZI|nr:sodium/hydrogen exchanger family protein [Schizothecium vesticola]
MGMGLCLASLNFSELNIILSVLGAFILLFGIISIKIKNKWFLGEALPAVFIGVLLGLISAKFIDRYRWGSETNGQTSEITLGMARAVIGVQLVIAGFQLPAKYTLHPWKEITICLLPAMALMWLCTTLCMLATVPKITLLAALVIGSCVTCTDPILSQAIAKGPFADKFAPRHLREIISAEAGADDGFGFPFLMLAVYLIRHADVPGAGADHSVAAGAVGLGARSGDVGRLGEGVGVTIGQWFLETWLYTVIMSSIMGAMIGYGSGKALRFRFAGMLALTLKWVDSESYLLYPTAVGFWILRICGMIGTNAILACFVAGNAMNWDGEYLRETLERHDEVNSCIDVLLNFGGFMYIGTIIPWSEFRQPETTGLTYGRLVGLGVLVLLLRRIPSIFMTYKFPPHVVKDWEEALFMGYFSPIGIGAVFYAEHTRHLFPELGEGDAEETDLVHALVRVVYWLVLFSTVVHDLTIPALNLFLPLRRKLTRLPAPSNAAVDGGETFISYNRFSRPVFNEAELPVVSGELPMYPTISQEKIKIQRRYTKTDV